MTNPRAIIDAELDNIGRVPRAHDINLRHAIETLEAVAAAWPGATVNVNHLIYMLSDMRADYTLQKAIRRD